MRTSQEWEDAEVGQSVLAGAVEGYAYPGGDGELKGLVETCCTAPAAKERGTLQA